MTADYLNVQLPIPWEDRVHNDDNVLCVVTKRNINSQSCGYWYPKCSGRYARENSVDLGQTAPKEQSDLGLHCL